jgi:radical SAM protein with 4Fe4S-binding SPASM domain
MLRRHAAGYNFVGNPETGTTFRWGDTFDDNPDLAPWPELADISISNYCTNGCRYCYRSSNPDGQFMSRQDYRFALDQLTSTTHGSIFQVALGGGEPLLHPEFSELLRLTRQEYGIIPNYTTCGKFFNQDNIEATRAYCGAIAISWDPYRDNMPLQELSRLGSYLKDEGIRTNIHYVISEKTLAHATAVLGGQYDAYIGQFNSVIFLTYKPAGRADSSDSIRSPHLLQTFLKGVEHPATKLKIGFDACFVPSLLKATNVDHDLIDSCECGFFSIYVNENLDVMPCSFCNNDGFSFNLRQFSFEEIWRDKLSGYRNQVAHTGKSGCADCSSGSDCRRRCPLFPELFLCDLAGQQNA